MKFLLVVAATLAVVAAGKVHPSLRAGVKAGTVTEGILELPQIMEQVEASQAFQTLKGDARVHTMISMLEGLTGAAQAPYVALMKELGLEYQQFWASNIVLVKGLTEKALLKLEDAEGDFILREQHTASINPVIIGPEVNITTQNPQWGVAMVRAPQAWTVTQGQNMVVSVIDTGIALGHEALSAGYAGWFD